MNEHSFLGYDFSNIQLTDINALSGILVRHPQPLTGYTFSTLAAWNQYFHYKWVLAEPDLLLISCILDSDPNPQLLQPIGSISPAALDKLIEAAGNLDYPLKIIGASRQFVEENPDLSHHFEIREDRAVSNYLYSATALANLSGRKYSKKRNLLAQASGLYQWSCQKLTMKLTDSCFYVLDSILKEESPKLEGMLARELSALECTLRHFDEFCQQGLLISANGRAAAFSVYEPINPATIAVHFERALRSYKGLYQVVNWETAKVAVSQGFEYINREEDLGDEGLRDAKMSYHPIEIIPAFELTFRKPV